MRTRELAHLQKLLGKKEPSLTLEQVWTCMSRCSDCKAQAEPPKALPDLQEFVRNRLGYVTIHTIQQLPESLCVNDAVLLLQARATAEKPVFGENEVARLKWLYGEFMHSFRMWQAVPFVRVRGIGPWASLQDAAAELEQSPFGVCFKWANHPN